MPDVPEGAEPAEGSVGPDDVAPNAPEHANFEEGDVEEVEERDSKPEDFTQSEE